MEEEEEVYTLYVDIVEHYFYVHIYHITYVYINMNEESMINFNILCFFNLIYALTILDMFHVCMNSSFIYLHNKHLDIFLC